MQVGVCNSSHIRTEANMSSSPAGPRIAFGNNLRPGRNPSIFPDTSSKHMTPVDKIDEIF